MSRRLALLVIAVVLVAGCSKQPAPAAADTTIGYWHDAKHHVSCWTFGYAGSYAAAISCLPDSQVTEP